MGRIDENMTVVGAWQFQQMPTFPSGISNAQVASGAAIDQSKLQHQHRVGYSQPNTTATTETRVLYRCYGATATLIEFAAGSIAACAGAATITLDLKKNGTTMLTSVITLDNANTARVAETAALSVTSIVAGDVLEVVVTATAGGGTLGTGLFASLTIKEDAA